MNLEHYTVLKRDDGLPWELGRGATGITYKAFDALKPANIMLVMGTSFAGYPGSTVQ